jgi:hypothetical protein
VSLHKESSDGEDSLSLPIRYPFEQGKVGQTLHSQGLGREPNKNLLIDFRNQLLPPQHQIQDLTYAHKKQMEFPSTSLSNSPA